MKYLARIESVSDGIEGEVSLSINGLKLVCFGYSSLPYGARAGEAYDVELFPVVLGEYIVCEICGDKCGSIVRIGNTFSYFLNGRLDAGCLDVGGVVFEDEVLLSDFGYLDGKMISWKVDRIDVDFMEDLEGLQNSL